MTEFDLKGQIELATKLAWIGCGVEHLVRMVEQLRDVPGDIVELGAYKAGSSIAMAAAAQAYPPTKRNGTYWGSPPAKKVWAFDTYEGMPEVSEHDLHKRGDFNDVQFDVVRSQCRHLSNLILVKGEFKHTVPAFPNRPMSLVVLDCDLYQSHKLGLAKFWPNLRKGGILVAEDYNFSGCPGATKAINEFFKKEQIEYHDPWYWVRKT